MNVSRPLPRKGTETIEVIKLISSVILLLNVSRPLPRKGTETLRQLQL